MFLPLPSSLFVRAKKNPLPALSGKGISNAAMGPGLPGAWVPGQQGHQKTGASEKGIGRRERHVDGAHHEGKAEPGGKTANARALFAEEGCGRREHAGGCQNDG